MGIHTQSTIAHAVKKLSQDCKADESEDDGSGTEQEIASTVDESMNSVVLDYLQLTTMPHMRCAAHNLQLAIRDGLKIVTVASLIIKISRIAAAARIPKVDALLKRKMNKVAILDQAFRWASTYLRLKDFWN